MNIEPKTYYISAWNSPIGTLKLVSNDKALEMLLFENEKPNKIEALTNLPTSNIIKKSNLIIDTTIHQLQEYFAGERKHFELPLYFTGTTFQQLVWQNLQQIPYGEIATYSQLASSLGDANKIRAVAAANAKNDIMIIVPCHRIIGEKHKLVGYRGGLEQKKWLINFEKEHSPCLIKDTLF